MSPPARFRKTCRVRSYDVGHDQRLTLPSLLRELHDAAQDHAAEHGFGYRDLFSRKLAWALVALDLRLHARPTGGSTYEIATSVAKHVGPVVYRDYLAGPAGAPFAVGQSMWVLIDLDKRRSAAPPDELRAALAHLRAPLQSVVPRVQRLLPREPTRDAVSHAHRVGYHDCDFNGHLNNVVAARWLLDAAQRFQLDRLGQLARLRITYHHELRYLHRALAAADYDHDGDQAACTLLRDDGKVMANLVLDIDAA